MFSESNVKFQIHKTSSTSNDTTHHEQIKKLTDVDIIKQICKDDVPEIVTKVLDLYKDLNIESSTQTVHMWDIIKLEFVNMGIYGMSKVNIVDVSSGITNICARNTAGKSTILNCIIFGLFGKYTSLNNKSRTGYVKITISVDGDMYEITRTGKRQQIGRAHV